MWDDVGLYPVTSGEMNRECDLPSVDIVSPENTNSLVVSLSVSRRLYSSTNITEYTFMTWDENVASLATDGWDLHFSNADIFRPPERSSGLYPGIHPLCSGISKESLFNSTYRVALDDIMNCNDDHFWSSWTVVEDGLCATFLAVSRPIPIDEWVISPSQRFTLHAGTCTAMNGTTCVGYSNGAIYSVAATLQLDGHIKTAIKTFSFEITFTRELNPSPSSPPFVSPPPPSPPLSPETGSPPPPNIPPSPLPDLNSRHRRIICKIAYWILIILNLVVSLLI